jgi:hypothetical protein
MYLFGFKSRKLLEGTEPIGEGIGVIRVTDGSMIAM